MFQLTCIGWLIFRADNLGQLIDFVHLLFVGPYQLSTSTLFGIYSLLVYALPVLVFQGLQFWWQDPDFPIRLGAVPKAFLYWLLLFALMALGNFGGQDFIYFQF